MPILPPKRSKHGLHLLLKQLVGAYHVVVFAAGAARVARGAAARSSSCCAWAWVGSLRWRHEGARTYRVVYVAHDDMLNIRSGPSVGYPIVGRIPPGGRGVRVVGHCQGWCPVSYNGASGWVNPRLSRSGYCRGAARQRHDRRRQLCFRARAATSPWSRRRRASALSCRAYWQVTGVAEGESLKVHDAPSSSASVVHAFEPQTGCIKLTGGCQKPWCQVKFPGLSGDRVGWVDSKHLAPSALPAAIRSVALADPTPLVARGLLGSSLTRRPNLRQTRSRQSPPSS